MEGRRTRRAGATPTPPAKKRKRRGGEDNEDEDDEDFERAGSSSRRGRGRGGRGKRGRKPGRHQLTVRALSKEEEEVQNEAMDTLKGEDAEGNEGIPSRSYFRVKEGSGVGKKSANKVTDIGIVEEKDLRDALAKLTPKHEMEQRALVDSYRAFYQKWHFQSSCGFGLLMYGFGSKKSLLEDFADSALRDSAAVVVNGYLSNINIKHDVEVNLHTVNLSSRSLKLDMMMPKDARLYKIAALQNKKAKVVMGVVHTIVNTLWDASKMRRPGSAKLKKDGPPVSSNSLADLLAFLTDEEDLAHVYMVVHNIDGPGLRDDDIQQTLATVASSKHVRIVASIDNVNAPILWDKQMARSQFKWLWLHTPTYVTYVVEAAGVPLLLAAGAATKNARSAVLVLQSLTPNAQSVFRVLAEFQIGHPDDQGLPLNRLYTVCREQFLVSSEVTLRAHLTEFKDHELLKFRRGSDGQDCLYIPLPTEALTKLLQDIAN